MQLTVCLGHRVGCGHRRARESFLLDLQHSCVLHDPAAHAANWDESGGDLLLIVVYYSMGVPLLCKARKAKTGARLFINLELH